MGLLPFICLPLFPACAGVILSTGKREKGGDAFPRMRGGDPPSYDPDTANNGLFPACAGVIPKRRAPIGIT